MVWKNYWKVHLITIKILDIKQTFNCLTKNKKGKVFNNLKDAYYYFRENIHNNDLLMVKGSNATGLNQFSKNIKKGQISVI